MLTMEEILRLLIDRRASDVHLSAGSPPRLRVDGELVLTDYALLDPETSQKLIYSILDSTQIATFEREHELDMSFGISGIGRFRVNVFQQRGAVGAAIRLIPFEIKTFADLGLPADVCEKLCELPKGLVLLTGPTGCGKSTTLASMINFINERRRHHIVTIEDPIEFVHKNKMCLVNQREVGSDTQGFKEALRHVLRQDPDIVLIGEMRDLETIEAALTLAETGHLTFATLHTSDTVQTINRIIDVFPATQQSQVRTLLSFVLQAVFCQQLLPHASGKGRTLCAEVMLPNEAVRALIRDDKTHQIYSVIQTSGRKGMMTMNQALFNAYEARKITYEMAMESTMDVEDLKRMFQRG